MPGLFLNMCSSPEVILHTTVGRHRDICDITLLRYAIRTRWRRLAVLERRHCRPIAIQGGPKK